MAKKNTIEDLKKAGKEFDSDLHITRQANLIIGRIDNFPYAHFKKWWQEKYGRITGGQLHDYMSTSFPDKEE